MEWVKENVSKTLIVLVIGLFLISTVGFHKGLLVATLCSAYMLKESIAKLANAWAKNIRG
jgi:hypothetical protein